MRRKEGFTLLHTLAVSDFRNLTRVRLERLSRHNVIFGKNGSGKTSLLEAAHILGTARSFRGGKARSQVQYGKEGYVIHGVGTHSPMGVQRGVKGEVLLRVGGETVRSASRLADELPLLVINSASFELLLGEPAQRRRLMDWGVFHVEHAEREVFPRFQRALTQRNHLLRRGSIDPVEMEVWTSDLAAQGNSLAEARGRFVSALQAAFLPILTGLAPELDGVTLSYRRGWDANATYVEVLKRSTNTDLDQGFTHAGPQRADIRVLVNGYPAAETLSRGQQKLLIIALKLAQGHLVATAGVPVLFLIDDLPSELDEERCEKVCRRLADMRAQTLITCIDPESVPVPWLSAAGDSVDLFHVEHGNVSRTIAD
ncbi:MAG: DNA replication/repair protein RecF [Pseudomonadota bacterium]